MNLLCFFRFLKPVQNWEKKLVTNKKNFSQKRIWKNHNKYCVVFDIQNSNFGILANHQRSCQGNKKDPTDHLIKFIMTKNSESHLAWLIKSILILDQVCFCKLTICSAARFDENSLGRNARCFFMFSNFLIDSIKTTPFDWKNHI